MKPLNDEQARILRAIRDGRFVCDESQRYAIEGEARPDRRERERVFKRRLCGWGIADGFALTDKGRTALANYEAHNYDLADVPNPLLEGGADA